MNKQLIKQALDDLADQAIPESYDPNPVVREQLEKNLHFQKDARKEVRPRLRLAGLATLIVILAGTIFFLTPPGRVVAQDVIRFFTRAGGDVLPLPAGRSTEAPPPTRTAAPTQILSLQDVTSPVNALSAQGYPTATPIPGIAAGSQKWNLTIEQAEELAGFKLRVPASLPPGYRLDNVIFDLQTREVVQIYGFHPYSAGEQFILHQRPSEPTDVIGQSAVVQQMTIGGIEVEYVGGSWFDDSGGNTETWQTDSIFHTFRWLEGDFYFSLEILFDESDTWSPAYWTKDGMLAMVEIILVVRAEFPEQVNLNYLTSIEQAEEVSGFVLLVPSMLPEGFVFSRAVYDPQVAKVLLFFQPEDGSRYSSGVRLVIIEKQITGQPTRSWDGYPQDAVAEVMVGSSHATFVSGSIVDGIYDPDSGLTLIWNTTNLSIEMIYSATTIFPGRLEKAELIAIAESMKP